MDSTGRTAMPLESRRLGVIKWYNAKKGFGFICPDLDDIPFTIGFVGRSTQSATSSNGDTADAAVRRPAAPADVFMHKSVLQPGVSLKDNERVEFEMGVDKKGRKVAVRVWQSTKPRALHHRQWVAADFQQLKSLHEEWFPVRYPDSYWRQACERHLSLEGWPLLTLTSHTPDNAGRIVGCISAVIMDIDACIGLDPVTIIGAGGIASKPTQDSALLPFHRTLVSLIASAGQINIHGMACYCDCGWSCADANGHPAETAVYLKTLGVREEARRHGCAIELVNACELYAKEVGGPSCGALWLHVIAYNRGAIRLYERAGFRVASHLPQFYCIQGERFDAYLYVKNLWSGNADVLAETAPAASMPEDQCKSQPSFLRDWI